MPRYNFRMLRGERVVKKMEGNRIKRWELDYKRFVKDGRNVLSVEEVMAEITQSFENNAIEQEKVSLICPLTKKRISMPVRYRTCRHLQCFDLKGFLEMKNKRNILECPICNSKLDNELDGLCIDKYFQKILSDVSGAIEIEILGNGTFKAAFCQSAVITPKVIDDEEPYAPDHSTTHIVGVKSETNDNVIEIDELDSDSSFDVDNVANESDAETQNVHISDTSMAGDISQAVEHSTTHIDETKSESGSNSVDVDELGSVSSFDINNKANDAEIHNVHISGTSMASDITVQAEHSTNAKGSLIIDQMRRKCSYCSYSTNYTSRLLRHIRTHTGEKPFKCVNCTYAAVTNGDLQIHMRIHTGEKPYKCDQCSYACAHSGTLKSHMRTHTGAKPYKCDQCSYACARAGDLKTHMRTHTGEKPYKCTKCSYASATSSHLNNHMLTHTSEKPYKCDKCSYASAGSYELKKHMRIHTGEKPYKCDQCSFKSALATNLTRHMRTHSGEKSFKCVNCTYSALSNGNLQRHIRIHTGEKPYKCDLCTFATGDSSALRSHILTHTGEKPYKCSQCSFACAKSSNLKAHIRTHTGEKPYKCDQCSYACAQSGALKSHMRSHI